MKKNDPACYALAVRLSLSVIAGDGKAAAKPAEMRKAQKSGVARNESRPVFAAPAIVCRGFG